MKETTSLPIAIPQTLKKIIYMLVVSLSFIVPFSFGHSQLVTGVIINAILFLSVFLLKDKECWPLVVLPSLAAISRGVVFGPATPFLVYFLPFIWFGNYILVKITKQLHEVIDISMIIFLAAVIKFMILNFSANLLYKLGFVPQLFLKSMGIYQLVTAIFGGILALIISKIIYGKFQS